MIRRIAAAFLALSFLSAPVMAQAAVKIPALVVPSDPGLLPDMTLGNPNAPVTVVEYASAACPHCAAWKTENWANFQSKYIASGKVRYVFREVLTSPQQYALSAFLIGRCAVAHSKNPTDSTPYFTVVNAFFAGQAGYFQSQQIGTVMADVTAKTGMTTPAMQACVSDETGFSAFMKTMRAHMEKDGVTSTPTFLVNGKRVDGHEMAALDAAIASAK
ncbi:DsbA family protein [Asticcacaulis sp.]|uniref:DsbA family protein n=1 Tax=Asticcacaulis sp. TaxID=1872648 RepID=UPI002BFD8CE9|nr:DsbA family protein [Asticcacaulis sp.]HTM83029.1 DsbA family protein [Asticcacaulis sp.]